MQLSMPTKVLSSAIPVIVLVAAVYWLVFALSYQKDGPSVDGCLHCRVLPFTQTRRIDALN